MYTRHPLERRTDFHVAVPCFRPARLHAEGDDAARASPGDGLFERGMQRIHIFDGGVGCHHPDHGLRVGLRHEQRRRGHGGGGVTAHRLQNDARIVDARTA